MVRKYVEGESFTNIDGKRNALTPGTYENCTFTNCNLANADLSDIVFVECIFEQCDLSVANIQNTAFRDVVFKNCKLLGLHFENTNALLFGIQCKSCQLQLSSFYQCSLKDTLFQQCSLQEVDFTEADLTNARFVLCDLSGAIFDHTILEKADLRTAYHYAIHPENNRIKKAKFSLAGIPGLLEQYDIEIE